jgi:GT2 family glycosyltransferase
MNTIKQPLVYAIILNWNSFEETIALSKQLIEADYQNLRILVVDNHSTRDNSAIYLQEAASSLGFKLICNNSNLGYAGGNNIGINKALDDQSDFIWILNPDIRVESDTLKKMIETAMSSDKIAGIGSRICFRTDKNLIYSDGGILTPEEGYKVTHLHNKMRLPIKGELELQKVDYINGSSILLNAKAVHSIGKFREDFFLYFEEAEWCLRAKNAGWIMVTDTRAIVYHSPSSKGPAYHYYMTRNRIWLSKIDGNKRNYRATVAYEKDKIFTYVKDNILGTLIFRIRVCWAKINGLIRGVFSNVKQL